MDNKKIGNDSIDSNEANRIQPLRSIDGVESGIREVAGDACVSSNAGADAVIGCDNARISSHAGAVESLNTTASCQKTVIKININDVARGTFDMFVRQSVSIEIFKAIIASKFKIPTAGICLLFEEKELFTGTLLENRLTNESTVKLMPKMISSSMSVSSEEVVLQFIETLHDKCIEYFLSGKIPLFIHLRFRSDIILFKLKMQTMFDNISMMCSKCIDRQWHQTQTNAQMVNELLHRVNLRLRRLNRFEKFRRILYHRTISRLLREIFSTPSISTNTGAPTTDNSQPDEAVFAEANAINFMKASKILTQTLRRFSKEIFVNKLFFATGCTFVFPILKKFNLFSEITFRTHISECLHCGIPKRDTTTIINFLNDVLKMIGESKEETNLNSENISTVTSISDNYSVMRGNPRIFKRVRTQNLGFNGNVERQQQICTCCSGLGVVEEVELCKVCVDTNVNSRTKSKLENIRHAMKQNKEKRDARKREKNPYNVPIVNVAHTKETIADEATVKNLLKKEALIENLN